MLYLVPIHEKENYSKVLRHYVYFCYLYYPEQFEICHARSLILVTLRTVASSAVESWKDS